MAEERAAQKVSNIAGKAGKYIEKKVDQENEREAREDAAGDRILNQV